VPIAVGWVQGINLFTPNGIPMHSLVTTPTYLGSLTPNEVCPQSNSHQAVTTMAQPMMVQERPVEVLELATEWEVAMQMPSWFGIVRSKTDFAWGARKNPLPKFQLDAMDWNCGFRMTVLA